MAHPYNITVAVLPMAFILDILPNGDLTGSEWTFLKEVLVALGLNYRIVIPEDKTTGRFINGSFTGIIGMVQRDEADLAIGTLVITALRREYVEFSTPYKETILTFGIEGETTLRATNAYLSPFDFPVWMCLLVCLIVASSTCWTSLRRNYSYFRIFFEFIANTLKQPYRLSNKNSLSVKAQLMVWSYFSMVLGACYTGTLLSFMTIPMKGRSVETLKELSDAVKMGTHKCYSGKGSFLVPFLISSGEPYLQELGESIDRNSWYHPFDTNKHESFIKKNTALILRKQNLEIVKEISYKDIFISKDIIVATSNGIAINRNFCCKQKLNQIISRLREAGIIDKIIDHGLFKIHLRSSNNYAFKNKIRAISVEDISGMLMVLIVGFSIAIFTFCGDWVFNLVKKRR